jgi:aspartate racemase
MKTIGLLGGMSWESTVAYYREINEAIKQRLGGFHSAKIILYSVDFAAIEKLQRIGDWDSTATILKDAARSIETGGADFLLICTNTMHMVAEEVENAINIPFLHIADATAEVLIRSGVKKVGLLGTAFTMEQAFYKERLSDRYGIDVVIPDAHDRKIVHDIIFQELCMGTVKDSSKQEYLRIIDKLDKMGAEGVILGCTEIGMLVSQDDTETLLYDTTKIHAAKAVDQSL